MSTIRPLFTPFADHEEEFTVGPDLVAEAGADVGQCRCRARDRCDGVQTQKANDDR